MSSCGVVLSCFVVLLSVQSLNAFKPFPAVLKRCNPAWSNITQCFFDSIEAARPYIIRNELPELLPKVTPLFIPEIELTQGSESVSFQAFLRNVSLYGLEKYKFTEVKVEKQNKTLYILDVKVEFPEIYIEGNYIVDGKILLTPLKGNGFFHTNLTNVGFSGKVLLRLFKKNKLTYFEPLNPKYDTQLGKIVDYGIDGLFKESEVLAAAVQNVIQENIDLLVEEVRPAINEVIKKILDEYMIKRTCRYPLQEIYLNYED